jgi:hypothetical protein
MENHRIGLFIPSVPDFVPENGDRASKPVLLRAGETLSLECTLMMTTGPVLTAVREWIRDRGGLPAPNPWPRSFQEELDVCRAGFLTTIWDGQNEKWRHCIDWASSHAPGFAALLWMDSRVAENAGRREQSRARVELAAKNMLRDGGPELFSSTANCHIMQWEFPFLYGCLPEAMASVDGQIRHLIETQQTEGGWIYEPANREQAALGQTGDSVLGTCANRAATILRYARITGDTNANTDVFARDRGTAPSPASPCAARVGLVWREMHSRRFDGCSSRNAIAAPNVPRSLFGDLALLPDRPAQNRLDHRLTLTRSDAWNPRVPKGARRERTRGTRRASGRINADRGVARWAQDRWSGCRHTARLPRI